jgi:hypothetical protein
METLGIFEFTDLNEELYRKAMQYEKHLERVKQYQKNNPEKVKEKQSRYYTKLKQEFPDKYWDMINKKRQYYIEVVRPKQLEKKMQEKKMQEKKELELNATL